VESRRRFIINFIYTVLAIAIAYVVVRYIVSWMLPFVLAIAAAALLQRPVKWLVKRTNGGKKFFSVALVIALVLTFAGLIALLGWLLVAWIADFVSETNIETIQSALTSVTKHVQQTLVNVLNTFSDEAGQTLMTSMESVLDKLLLTVSGWLTALAEWVLNLTKSLPKLMISFIVWVVASVFCTIDYDNIIAFFARQLPSRARELVSVSARYGVRTVSRVFRAYLLMMLVTFAELSIGFLLLSIPNAFLIAALVAVVDILPVLGTGTVLIPWSVLSLLLGDYTLFIGLVVLYILITVVRNVLEPRLVSEQIGLNPLVTLFFMYFGLQAVGVLGLFVFPITAMVLKRLQDDGHIRLWK